MIKILIWHIIIYKNHPNIFHYNGKKYLLLLLVLNIYFFNKYKKNINYNNFLNFLEKIKFNQININNYFINGHIDNLIVSMILILHF
jgi:hypothetical protein